MESVAPGRINCANMTDPEWALLSKLEGMKLGWYVPSDQDWLTVRGVLALVDVRRGWKPNEEDDSLMQIGWPQLRINVEGVKALRYRERGEVYQTGKPATEEDVNEAFYVSCQSCGGTGDGVVRGEGCVDCDGDGYLLY